MWKPINACSPGSDFWQDFSSFSVLKHRLQRQESDIYWKEIKQSANIFGLPDRIQSSLAAAVMTPAIRFALNVKCYHCYRQWGSFFAEKKREQCLHLHFFHVSPLVPQHNQSSRTASSEGSACQEQPCCILGVISIRSTNKAFHQDFQLRWSIKDQIISLQKTESISL